MILQKERPLIERPFFLGIRFLKSGFPSFDSFLFITQKNSLIRITGQDTVSRCGP